MDESPAMEHRTNTDRGTSQSAVRIYLLPKYGFPKYWRSLALQVALCFMFIVALGILAHFISPEATWTNVALFSVCALLALLFYLPLLHKRQKQLWQKVVVEVGDHCAIVYHGVGWMPDVYLLPQLQVRVDREQVTAIREMSYGLALATRYDPQALVIPIQLGDADYREIVRTLSMWCSIQPRSDGTVKGKLSRMRARLAAAVEIANRKPLFFDRGVGLIQVGGLVGVIIGTLPGLFAIVEWSKGRDIPINLAWVILTAYTVNLFVTIFCTQIAFAWLDYGLARAGMNRPARSALWFSVAAAVMIGAFVVSVGMNVTAGLIVVFAGTLVVAALAWLWNILQIKTETPPKFSAAFAHDPASYTSAAGIGSDISLQGAYRLTAEEFVMAFGYFILSQPRSYGKPRVLSVFLPRSVDREFVDATFSSHPFRNMILHFSADRASITWRAGEFDEKSLSWEQVEKIIRTPKGFLLCWRRSCFDWIPLPAFFAMDGAKAFVELVRHHPGYSETA